jgi:hypothetical protein
MSARTTPTTHAGGAKWPESVMVARAQRVYLRSSKAGGNGGGLQIRGARSGRDHGMGAMPRPDSRVGGNQARGSRHRATGPLPRLYATDPPRHPWPGAGECAHPLERQHAADPPVRVHRSSGRAFPFPRERARSLGPFRRSYATSDVTKTLDGRTPTQSVNFKVARLRPSGESAHGSITTGQVAQHPGEAPQPELLSVRPDADDPPARGAHWTRYRNALGEECVSEAPASNHLPP